MSIPLWHALLLVEGMEALLEVSSYVIITCDYFLGCFEHDADGIDFDRSTSAKTRPAHDLDVTAHTDPIKKTIHHASAQAAIAG